MAVQIPQNLSSLTVPKLKSLCKELKVTGYSKLGKNAIIEKIQGINQCLIAQSVADPEQSPGIVPNATSSQHSKGTTATRLPLDTPPSEHVSPSLDDAGQSTHPPQPSIAAVPKSYPTVTQAAHSMQTFPATPDQENSLKSTMNTCSSTARKGVNGHTLQTPLSNKDTKISGTNRKRKGVDESETLSSAKKLRAFAVPTLPAKNQEPTASQEKDAVGVQSLLVKSSPKSQACINSGRLDGRTSQRPATPSSKPVQTSTRRFRPLLASKVARTRDHTGSANNEQSANDTGARVNVAYNKDFPVEGSDFTASESANLLPVTSPPKLSERKRLQSWAIVLCRLTNEDRTQCARTCKLLRYAVFLSALAILRIDYPGRRLALLTQSHNCAITKTEPYLEDRQKEYASRLARFRISCLSSLVPFKAIRHCLWRSPDNGKQIDVACRFVLTRAWFHMSIHGKERPSPWLEDAVVDVQEVIPNEIWTVVVSSQSVGSQRTVYYILESTCEVIGGPPFKATAGVDTTDSDQASDKPMLRVDWSKYIEHRLLPPSYHASPPPPLSDFLKWTNAEEYDKGISRVWLKRIAGEGQIGALKKAIAERYIMACVVGNSVSGQWMPSAQLEQEFSGRALHSAPIVPRKENLRVNLFLPPHHHVESLHFATTSGQPLHYEIAAVQTPGREYFILRENGMEIGCEDDGGVWPIWQIAMKCDHRGVKTDP